MEIDWFLNVHLRIKDLGIWHRQNLVRLNGRLSHINQGHGQSQPGLFKVGCPGNRRREVEHLRVDASPDVLESRLVA